MINLYLRPIIETRHHSRPLSGKSVGFLFQIIRLHLRTLLKIETFLLPNYSALPSTSLQLIQICTYFEWDSLDKGATFYFIVILIILCRPEFTKRFRPTSLNSYASLHESAWVIIFLFCQPKTEIIILSFFHI